MKKIIFLSILIFSFSIGIGFFYGKIVVQNKDGISKISSNSNTSNQTDEKIKNEISTEAVSVELKVKPNIEFGIKEYYDECGHFNFEYTELPKELINMTKEEIEEHYNGNYEVEEFDNNKLVLSREINGLCDNHYVIKLNENNIIDVYKINTDTSYSLIESTKISKDFLPESDVEELEEGIMVYGIGKVNSILEDYE